MNFDTESLQKQIPYYLTEPDRKALLAELKGFASGNSVDFFLSRHHDAFKETTLQGDGWSGFEFFIFESGERRTVRGIILSNSCDIDPENTRELSTQMVFSPLVKLSVYKTMLIESGIDPKKVEAKITSIKAQKTTNIFYLPASGTLAEDFIVRLDVVQSMPTAAHKEREKLFTLSMVGFYLLVFKLSVQFWRIQENVKRN